MKRLGARAIVRAAKQPDTALQAAAAQWSQAATAVLVQLTERVDALTARVEALEAERVRPRMRRRPRALAPRPLVRAARARRAEESDGWTFAPCVRAERPCTTRRGGSCRHAPSGQVCACLCHVPLELHDRYTRGTP